MTRPKTWERLSTQQHKWHRSLALAGAPLLARAIRRTPWDGQAMLLHRSIIDDPAAVDALGGGMLWRPLGGGYGLPGQPETPEGRACRRRMVEAGWIVEGDAGEAPLLLVVDHWRGPKAGPLCGALLDGAATGAELQVKGVARHPLVRAFAARIEQGREGSRMGGEFVANLAARIITGGCYVTGGRLSYIMGEQRLVWGGCHE